MERNLLSVKRYEQREKLKELESLQGRGTELISLFVKPNKQISDSIAKLREEWSASSNIKSDITRKNVQDAIVKIIQKLKYIRNSGENGLAVFCGNLDNHGWILEIIEPLHPLNLNIYRCDDHFHVHYLLGMLEVKDSYGLVLIDTQKACIALLRGETLEILEKFTSGVEGKHDKGGQSQRRFERQRAERIKTFFKRIAEKVDGFFLSLEHLKGIIVGGSGKTKEKWVKGKFLDYRLQQKILKVVSIGYSDEQGLKETIHKSKEFLKNVRYVKEEELMDMFLKEIGNDSGLAVYGEDIIRETFRKGQLKILLLSDSLPRSVIEEFSKIIINDATQIEMISSKHESGNKLMKSFNGMAGISYYPLSTQNIQI